MNDIGRLFRALSDRTRLRVLSLLRPGEVCVGDLVTVLDAPQSTVSRHLAYLREAGLVEVEREGNWSYYRLAEVSGPVHGSLMACLGSCLEEVSELREDAETLARLREGGGCCSRPAAVTSRLAGSVASS